MKHRLRTKVWFPTMDKLAEAYCVSCKERQLVHGVTSKPPCRMTQLPEKPWEFLAIDLLGPLPSGEPW